MTPALKKRLDAAFSLYIRLQGAENGTNSCYTCGARMPWRELQCGHYIGRAALNTRWDTRHCRPQCVYCNVSCGGCKEVFRHKLLADGIDVADLERQAAAECTFTDADLQSLLKHYRAECGKQPRGVRFVPVMDYKGRHLK